MGRYPLNGLHEGNDISLKLPAHLRPTLDRFQLRFESSDTYQPGQGDVRNLSTLFFNLKLEPDYAAFGWRGWLASFIRPFLLALISLVCWGLAGFFVQGRSWQLAMQALAGVLLVASLLGWPQAAEPYYLPWTLLLLAFWVGLAVAERFARAAPRLPVVFVYAATLLPLMPLAQWIAGRLDFASVNPGLVALVVYLGALLVSTGVYLVARTRFETVLLGAFLVASALIFIYSQWRLFDINLYRGGDFRNYYQALLNTEETRVPLYDLKDMAENAGAAIRNPPGFAVMYWPFARLAGHDTNLAIFLWRIFNELILVPTLWLLVRLFGRSRSGLKIWPFVVFAVLNFGQIAESVGYGQHNTIMLFGLVLTGWWVYKSRDTLAGLALSLPIWVKLLPAVSGAFFVLERRWRGLAGLIAGAVIFNLLTSVIVGWDNVWFYFTKALWNVNEPELGISNQSWWGFMGRLFVPEVKDDFIKGSFPTVITPLCYLGVGLALALTLAGVWRAHNGDWLSQQLKLGALALVALWVPPFSWMHYIVPALVAIAALAAALGDKNASRPAIIVLALAYVLLAYGGRSDFFFVEAVGLNRLGSSYRFLATFALWALNLWLLWRPHPRFAKDSPTQEALATPTGSRPSN